MPVAALKNWANIRNVFTKVNPKWNAKSQITGQIRADDKRCQLWMVPAVDKHDSIGYNPPVRSAEEVNTWTAMFDKKWKGKSSLNTDPLIAIGQAVMAMNTRGLSNVENPGNPSEKEISEAMKCRISLGRPAMSTDTPVAPFTVPPCSALEWGALTAGRANSPAGGLPRSLVNVLQATAYPRCGPSLRSLAGRAQR